MKEDLKVNRILVLYDVLNQYTTELKPETKQLLKQLTNNADNALRLMIKEIDRMD